MKLSIICFALIGAAVGTYLAFVVEMYTLPTLSVWGGSTQLWDVTQPSPTPMFPNFQLQPAKDVL